MKTFVILFLLISNLHSYYLYNNVCVSVIGNDKKHYSIREVVTGDEYKIDISEELGEDKYLVVDNACIIATSNTGGDIIMGMRQEDYYLISAFTGAIMGAILGGAIIALARGY